MQKLGIKISLANLAQEKHERPEPGDCSIDATFTTDETNHHAFETAISLLNSQYPNASWYLDSGATQHVSEDLQSFNSLELLSGNNKTAVCQNHPITSKDRVHFKLFSGEIKEILSVLYVLSLKKNLLSIGSFTDHEIIACVDNQKCILCGKDQKKVVAEGFGTKKTAYTNSHFAY